MERSTIVARGAAGGLLAGAVVAAWFAVTDLVAGTSLLTPAMLGSAVFGREFQYPSMQAVLAYTVLHFGTFAFLGAAAALVASATGATPGLILGLVFGLGVLNAFHYGAMLLGGLIAQLVLPPIHVIGANLLGGVTYAAYLRRASPSERTGSQADALLDSVIGRGLAVGLLGAATVATWFFFLDLLKGRPFLTPAALGAAVLLGADSPAQVQITPGIVAAYTLLHLGAFAIVGVAFVWGTQRLARAPGMWLLVTMTFIMVEGLFLVTLGTLGSWVLDNLGWWAVGVGNVLAVGTMGWAAWMLHPELRRGLTEEPVKTMV